MSDMAILLLEERKATLFPSAQRPSRRVEANGHDDNSAAPLLKAISDLKNASLILLIDTTDLEIAPWRMPPRLNAADKRKLATRRAAETFPDVRVSSLMEGASFSASCCLHDSKTGAAGEWLRRVENLPNFSGLICFAPFEAADMIRALSPPAASGWSFLLTWQENGCYLRQTATFDGLPVFTRLSRESLEEIPACLTASSDYLARHGLKGISDTRIVAVLPDIQLAKIKELPWKEAALFSPAAAAEKLGVPPSPSSLPALWLTRKRKPQAAASLPRVTAFRRETATARRNRNLAAAAWVMALAAMAWHGYAAATTWEDLRAVKELSAAMKATLEAEQTTLASASAPLDKLRLAVARRRVFSEQVASPWPLVEKLAKEPLEGRRVSGFEWKKDDAFRLRAEIAAAAGEENRSVLTIEGDAPR